MSNVKYRLTSALFVSLVFALIPFLIETWQVAKNVNYYSNEPISTFIENDKFDAYFLNDKNGRAHTLKTVTSNNIKRDLIARQKLQILRIMEGKSVVAELIEKEDFVAEKSHEDFENFFPIENFDIYQDIANGDYRIIMEWKIKFPYGVERLFILETDISV